MPFHHSGFENPLYISSKIFYFYSANTELNHLTILQTRNINDFELLKKKIVAVMQQSYPGISGVISEWKGQDIINFQEELRSKVNGYVSEKWFYNHFKSEGHTFPRIDMLNLLSRYAGYLNWDDFRYRNGMAGNKELPINRGNWFFILLPAVVGIIGLVLYISYQWLSYRNFRIVFFDNLTREQLSGDIIQITIFPEKGNSSTYLTDSLGHLTLRTNSRSLKMVVNVPYYKTDTITCMLKNFEKEVKVGLNSDEFARMIQLFSEMNVSEWVKRRAQLEKIIDDQALIYQVGGGKRQIGVELFTREEFIDKLSMPTSSLRNLDVLETKLKNSKIILLRFRVNADKP
jgi:hypothetical protein